MRRGQERDGGRLAGAGARGGDKETHFPGLLSSASLISSCRMLSYCRGGRKDVRREEHMREEEGEAKVREVAAAQSVPAGVVVRMDGDVLAV